MGGTVRCWGAGGRGELGNDSLVGSGVPVDVRAVSNATAVAAGATHSCALVAGGAVKCWGSNDYGELGNGGMGSSSVPVDVVGISGATAIAAGGGHSCALLPGGVVKCWGHGLSGELGNNTHNSSNVPVTVAGITGATAITASGEFQDPLRGFSCALVAGAVECWGSGDLGQLGGGIFGPDSATPVAVPGITGASAVSSGRWHACALVTGGTVKCWGDDSSGQLGDGVISIGGRVPVDVQEVSGATAIGAGGAQSCAVIAGGGVKCWGEGTLGQLGNGSTDDSVAPVDVSGISGATRLTVGGAHSCVLVAAGAVKCWGYGRTGELGRNAWVDSPVPVDLFDPQPVVPPVVRPVVPPVVRPVVHRTKRKRVVVRWPQLAFAVQRVRGDSSTIGLLRGFVASIPRGSRLIVTCPAGCGASTGTAIATLRGNGGSRTRTLRHALAIQKSTTIRAAVVAAGKVGRFRTYRFLPGVFAPRNVAVHRGCLAPGTRTRVTACS